MAERMPMWFQEDLTRRSVLPCLRTSGVIYKGLDLKTARVHTNLDNPLQRHEEEEEKENLPLEDDLALVNLLKICTKHKDLCFGSKLHANALKMGCFTFDSSVGKSLLYMYTKCGSLAKAQQVFDELPIQDVSAWTSLIAGYAEMGYGNKALICFECMQQEGLAPDAVTFTCVLKACSCLGATEKAEELHNQIVTKGLLGEGVMLGSALVDMYCKLGNISKAQEVLDGLPVRNVVTWNALLAGYCQHGHGEKVLSCFDRMKREGLSPTAVTFACVLKACGSIRAVEKGKQLHSEIITKGLLVNNTVLGSALMDMYAKCGILAKAQQVFDELPVRDVVSWTSLITGYCQHGLGEEALNCLERMKHHGFSPNAMTFASVLRVCGSIGAAEKGKELHAEIVRQGWLHDDTALGNALLCMYAKCGILAKAHDVFDDLLVRSIISWSSLIAGYCEKGHGEEALSCFELMKHEGISPDAAVFACILKACGTIGAAEKGQTYFETMSTGYGILPSYEHHSCLVDLFCRTGHFEKAVMVIDKIPFRDHPPAWFALLGACRKWGTMKLGKLAFNHAVQPDE